jgi:hypothetical protein
MLHPGAGEFDFGFAESLEPRSPLYHTLEWGPEYLLPIHNLQRERDAGLGTGFSD